MELLVVIAIIGILVALLLPAIQAAREAARRISCQNNVKNLTLAVLTYEDVHKGLPPATTTEPPPGGGELLSITAIEQRLSWIVRILPQLEEQPLYDQFDLSKRFTEQDTDLRPEENQLQILMCPSDTARGRYYSSQPTFGRRFGKGNYAAYVSPEHVRNMRVFPGALINEVQPLSRIAGDGTSKTLLVAEVRTRDHEQDPRGAWAAAWTGGSVLAYDMHSRSAEQGANATSKRNSPFIPYEYTTPPTPPLPPNSPPSANNEDWIRECPDVNAATFEFMPCHNHSTTRSAAAPRSLHVGGVNASFIDGSVTWLANDIEHHLMARMISINDGQGNVEGYID